MARLFGYSPMLPDEILESTARGQMAPGDWVVATDDVVLASVVCAIPYFVTCVDGELLHGPDLFALAAARGEPWHWNLEAMRDMVWQGHASGTNTICAGVYRMPSDSVARAVDGRVAFEPRGWWLRSVPDATAAEAVDAIRTSVDEWPGRPLVSLSGGYDSRLLLAAAIAAGREPRLAVMGPSDSSDRCVAERLAKLLGLKLEVVELSASRYLDVGPEVARVTGGGKLASNWHTYHYAQAVAHHEGPHLVGANGEFARTFFLKGASAARLADALPPRVAVGLYFAARAAVRRRRAPTLLSPTFRHVGAYALEQSGHVHQAGRALAALDYYYATQRVRQLIGDGMALYRTAGIPISPFLDERWIRAVRGLARPLKLHDTFHRAAISKLAPQLATVGYDSGGAPYSPWLAAVSEPGAVDAVVECGELDEIWSRAQRVRAVSSPAALDLLHTVKAAITVRDLR